MAPLDHITAAVNAALREGNDCIVIDYYLSRMDDAARFQFDYFLLETDDAIAWQCKSPESRFFLRCLRELDRHRAVAKSAVSNVVARHG